MSKVQISVPTREQSVLSVLECILRGSGIPSEQYSVGAYAEECVCLDRTDKGWVVYDGERGKRYAVFASPDLYQACLEMLNRLAESEEHSASIQWYFQSAIQEEWERSLDFNVAAPLPRHRIC
ncbi:MAG: hypothetical protein K5990_02365 [Oscillospiraceae bacterium]|jgi:hypothetical protein|nr:hypothetical protein [Oscillospiraceae bacterium]